MTVIATEKWFRRGLLLVVLVDLLAGDPGYRSVSVDGGGQLHIVPDSGKRSGPEEARGRCRSEIRRFRQTG